MGNFTDDPDDTNMLIRLIKHFGSRVKSVHVDLSYNDKHYGYEIELMSATDKPEPEDRDFKLGM